MMGRHGLSDDAIVISGIAGRFPNSKNVNELKKNLYGKIDCLTNDHDRWSIEHPKIPHKIGVINDIAEFDRLYFGIHEKLCNVMEPTAKILLEHSVEAVMDSGINLNDINGKNISVYMNINLSESEKSLFDSININGFGIPGAAKAMISNRISFSMNLNGSSTHMDAGSAGGLVMLEKAFQAVRNDQCEGVIIGGGILSLLPHVSYQLNELGLLSPDGCSKSFDDDAEGHGRSESVAAMYIQKAKYAKRIYMEVVGVRTMHGNCNEINTCLFPSMDSQVELMKQVLSDCGLSPDDIAYLEASGVAIKDIDAEELEAIDRVYGKRKEPLYVGSIISNIGNTIPVNSINGIIKMIIGMEDNKILPNLHYKKPNSKSSGLKSGRLRVPTEVIPINGQYVAINTLSESGMFGTAILRSPNIEKTKSDAAADQLPRLITVSGRTEEAVESILTFLETNPVDVELCQLVNDVFESGIAKHTQRGYTILPPSGTLDPKLKIHETQFFTGVKRQVWWVFSGMGSQWPGMGKALLKIPVFNDAIQKCDNVIKPFGFDIYKIITEEDPKMFDNIIHSFIGIAAVQIGLVDVLRFAGLEPDFIIGHSVGELGCAYADGCLTADQMILAALSRGLASKEVELIPGLMAAVGLGYNDINPLCPPDIDVACHNGPNSTTISGPAESLKKFVASLTAKGIFAKEVASGGIAYHSRYIAPAGPKLLERLQYAIPNPKSRSAKWVSTSVPKSEWNSLKARLCSAEYHTNNLLGPVLFDETSRQIPPGSVCIEIAPHGLLQAILKKSLPSSCVNIPLTKRGHYDNSAFLLAALGKMYISDLTPKISNLYPKIEYPVGRGTPPISPFIKWDHSSKCGILMPKMAKASRVKGEQNIIIDLNRTDDDYLKANTIDGQIVIPLSTCLNEAWKTINHWETIKNKSQANSTYNVVFENIQIFKPLLTIPNDKVIRLIIAVLKGTGRIEIIDEVSEKIIALALIKSIKVPSQERLVEKRRRQKQEKYEIDHEDFYTEMEMRGFNYAKTFKTVMQTTFDGCNGTVRWDNDWITFIDGVLQLYAFGNDTRKAYVPTSIRKIVVDINNHENAVNISDRVKVDIDKNLDYISAGGLEIQGLQFSELRRQHVQSYLSNDILSIIPNVDYSNISLTDILRLVLQIVIENTFSEKLQKIELIDNKNSQNVKLIQKAFLDIPEINLFKYEIISWEWATFSNILTIITANFASYNIEEISSILPEGRFLFVHFDNAKLDTYLKSAAEVGLKTVFLRKSENEVFALLRKIKTSMKTKMVNITENENIKKSAEIISGLAKTLPSTERIAVLIKANVNNTNTIINKVVNQLEHTGTNLSKIRIFLLEGVNVNEDLFLSEFYKNQLELDLFINIFTTQKVWSTLRRTKAILNKKLCLSWAANQTSCNNPLSIDWTDGRSIDTNQNFIQVEYSTINPQDLLIATNSFYVEGIEKSRIEQLSLGLEFAGINNQLNRVMGITCGNSLANFVTVDPSWVWTIPKAWSFEDAVTVPLSYVIAYWALVIKAETSASDRVLVTNTFDGISLAVINLALHKKCDVFIAYETEAEEKLIKLTFPQLSANRLLKLSNNSIRDEILIQTNGEGVDVIIVNQCEIKQLDIYFSAVKQNARAVIISDLKDSEIHGQFGMYVFLKELNFYSVVPKKVLLSDSKTKKTLANMVQDGINNGAVKPLPRTVYQRESLSKAINICLTKENLGKIVVKIAPKDAKRNEALAFPRLHCSEKKSYVIIEGLTNFGIELIDWLITHGARQFVVASTLQVENGYQNLRFKIWQSYGVKINLHTEIDLVQQKNIKALLREAASLGVIDAIFDLRQTDIISNKPRISSDVAASSIKILDLESRSTCPDLRYFVVFAALKNAGILKNTRKTERYAANSLEQKLVDEIIEKRKKDNLPGLIVRLGLIKSTFENSMELAKNTYIPAVSRYVQQLDEILGTDENLVDISSYGSLNNEIEDNENLRKKKLPNDDITPVRISLKQLQSCCYLLDDIIGNDLKNLTSN